MDDKQVQLLQPLLRDIKDSGTHSLDVEQEFEGETYHVIIEKKTSSNSSEVSEQPTEEA